ncbi:hypothetical protein G3N55_06010 [Dissulfurirhabdus thermomarina]|uniref:Uncharacterized protein n=1 Tax=Dissulfurirhabdus thermomarina TaxID=1765737 RepID=A0A6N9TV65_DISTH|nr:hypothetical protein [Dissulfurirhabdus thermomarina]NDY42396.1 hypothetical protein [Dissulfurirhabdus thermomarina]NMX23234.1 hypothetical protein [Dissulfurirhabdus thermomarina]
MRIFSFENGSLPSRLRAAAAAVPFLVLSTAGPAWAVQVHGAPEGLVAHLLAHVFFAAAMLVFALRIRALGLDTASAWRHVRAGALFFVAWNAWAFASHVLDAAAGPLPRPPGAPWDRVLLESLSDFARYVLKNDHILAVPAMAWIYLGLRDLARADGAGTSSRAGDPEAGAP